MAKKKPQKKPTPTARDILNFLLPGKGDVGKVKENIGKAGRAVKDIAIDVAKDPLGIDALVKEVDKSSLPKPIKDAIIVGASLAPLAPAPVGLVGSGAKSISRAARPEPKPRPKAPVKVAPASKAPAKPAPKLKAKVTLKPAPKAEPSGGGFIGRQWKTNERAGRYRISKGQTSGPDRYSKGTHTGKGVYDVTEKSARESGSNLKEAQAYYASKGYVVAYRTKAQGFPENHLHFVDPTLNPREAARITGQRGVMQPTTSVAKAAPVKAAPKVAAVPTTKSIIAKLETRQPPSKTGAIVKDLEKTPSSVEFERGTVSPFYQTYPDRTAAIKNIASGQKTGKVQGLAEDMGKLDDFVARETPQGVSVGHLSKQPEKTVRNFPTVDSLVSGIKSMGREGWTPQEMRKMESLTNQGYYSGLPTDDIIPRFRERFDDVSPQKMIDKEATRVYPDELTALDAINLGRKHGYTRHVARILEDGQVEVTHIMETPNPSLSGWWKPDTSDADSLWSGLPVQGELFPGPTSGGGKTARSVGEVVDAVRYRGMLGNPYMHARNVVSQVTRGVIDQPEHVIEGILNDTLLKKLAKPESPTTRSALSGVGKWVKESVSPENFKEAGRAFKTGESKFSAIGGAKAEQFKDLPGGVATNAPTRALLAEDVLSSRPARLSAMHSAAMARGERSGLRGKTLKEWATKQVDTAESRQDAELLDIGDKAAKDAVFMKEFDDLGQWLDSGREITKGFGSKWIVPFMRVNYNFAREGLTERNLIGGTIKAAKQIRAGDPEASKTIARTLTSTTATAAAISYAHDGGIKNGRIKIPGTRTWIPYWQFGWMALPFAIADATTRIKKTKLVQPEKDWLSTAAKELSKFPFENMPFTQPLDIIKLLKDGNAKGIRRAITQIILQMNPVGGLMRGVVEATDQVSRDADTPEEIVKTGVPGLSKTVKPRLTPQGDELLRRDKSPQAIISPFRVNSEEEDPIIEEWDRLNINVGLVRDTETPLTPEEKQIKQQLYYEYAAEATVEMMMTPGYESMDPAVQRILVSNAVAAARRKATADFKKHVLGVSK